MAAPIHKPKQETENLHKSSHFSLCGLGYRKYKSCSKRKKRSSTNSDSVRFSVLMNRKDGNNNDDHYGKDNNDDYNNRV